MSKELDGSLSETFVEQIKQALAHLYNFPFLQKLAIAQQVYSGQPGDETAGHYLRRALVKCIETLNPGKDVFFRSPDGRIYNLLKLHYIDRITLQEVAAELGVSERQVYRDLRQGQLSVAELIWSTYFASPSDLTMQTEFERLKDNLRIIDLADLIDTAQNAVARLSSQYETIIRVEKSDVPVMIKTNVPIAQQMLISLLSYSIKQAHSNEVTVNLILKDMQPGLHLKYCRHQEAAYLDFQATPILQLAEQLNWDTDYQDVDDQISITLTIKGRDFTLLVIDDNEGLGELLTRYLSGYNCHIVASNSSAKGLALARDTFPTVIFLDVMMPEIDGWELLQRLRTFPETQTIPVVICSILYDPELAYSLGASYVLQKPITHDKLLDAIRALNLL